MLMHDLNMGSDILQRHALAWTVTKEADIVWSMGESKRTLSHILERCCDHMPLIIMLKWLARFGKHLYISVPSNGSRFRTVFGTLAC